ncbi:MULTISPECIES: phage repressor protein CI [unclassified Vibrio]|uniref:phage repressor protein CI n=1 Tax=unclassified Vibrio TaxID=2614977 RepID=UPI001268D175|nr:MULTISPECIES: phage repressor protein CI [unclassified Vibrio]QFT35951.1 Bacteriophage CI repressor helix-turn-helix domain protein [Vibrio sp. THAF64]QGM33851.1 Bacteriophage CI repressor helix-turn-helix domain protein [Vibrio sp. THAF191d]QGN69353.1 Bacteriophage CI repressor helix-turn-helix domain protein [Vibrio sp. THAF191c]
MPTNQEEISAFAYLSGKDFVQRLIQVTESKSQRVLSEKLGVPTSTISTWVKRGLTPHEIAVRAHLHTGVSLKWLLLGEGEAFPNRSSHKHDSESVQTKFLFDVDCYKILNGELIESRTLTFDKSLLDDLSVVNAIAIREGDLTSIIDKGVHQAVSGTYLVDMDGLLSLNEIQRLPGKKLAISFNGSTLTVEEDEVKVVGRVVLVVGKK